MSVHTVWCSETEIKLCTAVDDPVSRVCSRQNFLLCSLVLATYDSKINKYDVIDTIIIGDV